MGDETTKAVRRRGLTPFWQSVFSGNGIDIGAGGDGLSKYVENVRDWDIQDGDAQLMASVPDNSFDFVHSSHCLEHMRDAREALNNWFRIVKPGGYVVVVVPDWELYERKVWPSRFNPDHKQRFSLTDPTVTNLAELMGEMGEVVSAETLGSTIPEGLRPDDDWSCPAGSEPSIEVVAKKKLAKHSRGLYIYE